MPHSHLVMIALHTELLTWPARELDVIIFLHQAVARRVLHWSVAGWLLHRGVAGRLLHRGVARRLLHVFLERVCRATRSWRRWSRPLREVTGLQLTHYDKLEFFTAYSFASRFVSFPQLFLQFAPSFLEFRSIKQVGVSYWGGGGGV